MEKTIQKYIAITFLLSMMTAGLHATTSYFSARSQGTDAARELVGMANEYHMKLYDMDEFYGSFSITSEYTRSLRSEHITRCLFGSDLTNGDCDSILIQGSAVTNRGDNAWLADNFGLPIDFESRFTFEPRVSNVIVDFGFCLGFDNWCTGLYLKLHAPFAHTRWELNACENVIEPGTLSHLGGYFDAELSEAPLRSANPRSNLLQNASAFFIGNQAPTLGFNDNTDSTTRVEFNPLSCSRWSGCKETKNGLATFSAALGWNFLLEDDYHLGIEFRAAAPTGTRPKGCYLFEPIVGNGHHWELGGGISGHYTFWRCDDNDSSIGFWMDANIVHLLKTRQHRSFDLVSAGANSRYMLAMKMTSTVSTGLTGAPNAEAPSAQFDNLFQPVANLTCCDVNVSSSVQGDIAALFNYTRGCFTWDLGYNFWARSCEKIDFDCGECPCTLQNSDELWALKGDVRVFGYEADAQAITANSTSRALSATDSLATIHGGNNDDNGFNNSDADNPAVASFGAAALNVPTGVGTASVPVSLSLNPVTLQLNDIDLCSARTRGISHKIFTHVQWTWKDRECWVPYVGIGAKVEFAPGKSCGSGCDTGCSTTTSGSTSNNGISCSTPCANDCSSCARCNLSEWGVWLKGGISFN